MSKVNDLKQENKIKTRECLYDGQIWTKNDLAYKTSLSLATTTNILQEMLKSHEIEYVSDSKSTGGRKSKEYQLYKDYKHLLKIVLKKNKKSYEFIFEIIDLYDQIVYQKNYSSLKGTVEEFLKMLKKVLKKDQEIAVICLSLPGVCDQGMIDLCDFEDFQNKIWLSNEQELGLIKDFYDVLYINDFKLQNNDMLLKCSNMLFRISIYRVISSEILHNMAALKLCYAIIKNEIVLKTEIQTLLVCLLKLQDETVIKQTDSEQEALYKLRCRIISCKIAKELYVRGIKSDIVDGWKRISENKNEFIEIRNVVFDTTGDE